MSMISEFKKFALRGNVIDMAVGIIIGGAFTGVVKSLVDDVIMPPIGALTGGIDFKELHATLPALPGIKPATLPRNGVYIGRRMKGLGWQKKQMG